MKLKTTWELRQITLGAISLVLSCTGVLFMSLSIDWAHFMEVGLSMYNNVKWPEYMSLSDMLIVFNQRSVIPTLKWIPLTIVLDTLIRRYYHRLNT